MQLPQIRLQSQFAQLGLRIDKPVQEIEQSPAELSIEQPKADVQIETKKQELLIDTTEARASIDLKSARRRIEEAAQLGYEKWIEVIGVMSQQGDQLMQIENGGNAIADIAKEISEDPIYETNIAFLPPFGSVKIDWNPGQVNININPKKPIIDVKTHKPIHQYTHGKVSGEMIRWNSLKIDYTGITVDIKG